MATTLLCLALAVFVEARGEPVVGQEAVAHVVLNRAASRNLDACEVLTEKGQFTWETGRYFRTVKTKTGKVVQVLRVRALPIAKKGWNTAMAVALRVLKRKDTLQNIEFFHAKYVNPAWSSRLKRILVVGNHIFYAKKPELLASL